MKIAHIIGKNKKGGVESVVFSYVLSIVTNYSKYEFDIIYDADSTVEMPDYLIKKGVSFLSVPPYQHLFSYIKALKKIFRENKYDIVHCHISALNVFPLFAARLAGIKIRIAHSHTTSSKKERLRNFIKFILKRTSAFFATHLAACSEAAARWNYGNRCVENGKVKIFNNAVNIDRFTYNSDSRIQIRDNFNINGKFVVGHIGRFISQKNHEFIIDIFAELLKKRSDAVLLLIGDGDLMNEVKNRAKEKAVFDKIVFAGIIDDPAPYYSAMDVFILPSLYEGLPVVAVEAMVSGLDAYMSDAVTRECALNNQAKYLPISSASVWADKLSYLPVYNDEKRSESADFFKKSKFNIAKSSEDMVSYYDRLNS